jgi:hypothetical protein
MGLRPRCRQQGGRDGSPSTQHSEEGVSDDGEIERRPLFAKRSIMFAHAFGARPPCQPFSAPFVALCLPRPVCTPFI